jgi:ADP-ribose pyrophosphatase YjhB (NUDIX family)
MSQNNYEDSYLGQLRKIIGREKVIATAVRAVVFDEDGRLLLIRRRDNQRWALPAGTMELDESIYDCLVREVWEETGLTVQEATLFAVWSDPARTSIVTHYGDPYHVVVFVFKVNKWVGEVVRQTDETVDAGFFSLDEMPEMASHYHETLEDLASFEKSARLILK